jgi:hypothetical protein
MYRVLDGAAVAVRLDLSPDHDTARPPERTRACEDLDRTDGGDSCS